MHEWPAGAPAIHDAGKLLRRSRSDNEHSLTIHIETDNLSAMEFTMRRYSKLALAAFLALLFAPAARADAGTPLMWAGFFHLTIGNLMIGVGEGFLVRRFFRIKSAWVIPVMILANYASMIGGMCLIPYIYDLVALQYEFPFACLTRILVTMTVMTFILTLIIEWPFCLLIFRKRDQPIRKSIRANIIAQCVSYALLIPVYIYFSDADMNGKVTADQSILSTITESGKIYFIDQKNKKVCAIDLHGQNPQQIVDLKDIPDIRSKELNFWPGALPNSWNLCMNKAYQRSDYTKPEILIPNINGKAPKNKSKYSRVSDFREVEERDWAVTKSGRGIRVTQGGGQYEYTFYVETPFVRWFAEYPTVLPSNNAIFEFNGQIVCLDLNRRKIAFIADGYSPVVLLK